MTSTPDYEIEGYVSPNDPIRSPERSESVYSIARGKLQSDMEKDYAKQVVNFFGGPNPCYMIVRQKNASLNFIPAQLLGFDKTLHDILALMGVMEVYDLYNPPDFPSEIDDLSGGHAQE